MIREISQSISRYIYRIAELVRMALLTKHAGRVANAVIHVLPLGSAGMGDAHPLAART